MDRQNENKKQEKTENASSELLNCQKERDEYLAGWQRARADLINFKKEETERLRQIVMFANENLILDLTYILDSFSLIENSLQGEHESLKPFLLLKSQLENALKQKGLERLKTAKGDDFNPELHEAVEVEESREEKPHQILEVISEGYRLNGKLIRPARVKVSK
ncbi:MAG: Protein GrpE [Parcubacteria group bacterium GW2011_GWC1_45_9]|nr:MAG: Protein GrpE [Parcubacteria group bacterium GW2011_GWB1_45_10]KKU17264.1 MAG: Protein GrpE [Parcubacteria group bacterium GW2011_GWC1_45_9]